MTVSTTHSQHVTVPYEAITQHGNLKPTHLVRLFEDVAEGWWEQVAGMSRWSYFTNHNLRVLVHFVETLTPGVRVAPDSELKVELSVVFGPDSRRGFYGARDTLVIERPSGERVADWTSQWYWLDWLDGEMPSPRQEPPPALPVEHDTLPDVPPRWRGLGEEVNSFTWNDRESDLNSHVFFVSYIQRAQNAVGDVGLAAGTYDRLRAWYLRPSFVGDEMRASVEVDGSGCAVRIENISSEEDAAVIQFASEDW